MVICLLPCNNWQKHFKIKVSALILNQSPLESSKEGRSISVIVESVLAESDVVCSEREASVRLPF